MDEEERQRRAEMDRLYGAITAQKFAIENLWAFLLRDSGGTAADARATGAEMLRQFEDLPAVVCPACNKTTVVELEGVEETQRKNDAATAGLEKSLRNFGKRR